MKTYITDAALGYGQYAYLIRLDKSKNGYNYLCIGTVNVDYEDGYELGCVVKDLENIYITESILKIEESPLYGSFLFDFFIKNYKNE
jgi:hypothetical protein